MKKKLAELARLRAEAKSIIDNPDATAEELVQADAWLDDADVLQGEIKAMEARQDRIAQADAFMAESAGRKAITDPAEVAKTKTIPAQVRNEPDKFKTFGEFLGAVAVAEKSGMRTMDNRLLSKAASGMGEAVPEDGGFLVQTDHVTELLQRTYENSVLAPRCRRFPISGTSNSMTINANAETSRANGSRWGGIAIYWENEGDIHSVSQPKLRKMRLNLHKVAGLCYATDELLADSSALESWISQGFSEEFAFEIDKAILAGTGAGQPLGILNAACLVSVDAEDEQAATTIVSENVINMYARLWARSRPNSVWLYNQDIEPQLHTLVLNVGTGGAPLYMPAGGLSGQPYSTLYGRPCIAIEQAATLGTVGDIVLADMSQYLLADKGGMQAASSVHVRFLYDEMTYKFTYRIDGMPSWNSALTPYSGSANTLSPFVALASRT